MATSILFFSLLLVLPCFVDSVYFNFTSFQRGDPGNVIYHGDYAGRVGTVTCDEKVPIWSSKTGKLRATVLLGQNFEFLAFFIINFRLRDNVKIQ